VVCFFFLRPEKRIEPTPIPGHSTEIHWSAPPPLPHAPPRPPPPGLTNLWWRMQTSLTLGLFLLQHFLGLGDSESETSPCAMRSLPPPLILPPLQSFPTFSLPNYASRLPIPPFPGFTSFSRMCPTTSLHLDFPQRNPEQRYPHTENPPPARGEHSVPNSATCRKSSFSGGGYLRYEHRRGDREVNSPP